MKRWIQLAAKLYPRAWRERYGDEFDALIDDIEPVWGQLWNVMWEGVAMQLKTGAIYAKLAGAMAIVGAIAALELPRTPPREAMERLRQRFLNVDRHAQIAMVSDSAFRIGFTGGDPVAAQGAVRQAIGWFMEQYAIDSAARAKREGPEAVRVEERKLGENLEVLDPASEGAPQVGVVQWGWAIGIGVGLIAGIAARSIRGTPVPSTRAPA